MPDIKLYNPPTLAAAVGFSHAAEANGFVFLGGQTSTDSSGNVLFPGDIAAQFGQAIRNVGVALRAAGCLPKNAVKITYFVTDVTAYRAALREIGVSYRAEFGRHYPATSLFQVSGLFEPEAMIEIECIAVRSLSPGESA